MIMKIPFLFEQPLGKLVNLKLITVARWEPGEQKGAPSFTVC